MLRGYFQTNITPNGRFNYLTNLDSTVNIDPNKYNELRHLGAIYTMGQFMQRHPQSDLINTMVSAGDYMKNCCLRPFPLSEKKGLAIWSYPEINGGEKKACVKLGANGLGILAYLAINQIKERYISPDTLEAMGETILVMQRENGFFESTYEDSLQNYDFNFQSLFYPGEAILALLNLYQYDKNERWLEAALLSLKYICEQRKDQALEELPADHWILIATHELFEKVPITYYEADRSLFLEHGKRIVEKIISEQTLNINTPEINGTFLGIGSTTACGARLEALISFGPWIAEAYPDLDLRLRNSIHYALCFIQGEVITEGPLKGGITSLPKPVYALQERPAVNQIDNLQHIMSAWLWAQQRKGWLWPKKD